MRHLLGSCLALLLMAAPAPADDRRITDLTGEFSARGKTRIELRLAPGTIRIEPSPDANVRVNLGVYCAFDELGCEEKAERLALEAEYAGKSLEVRVDGLPSLSSLGLNVRGEIRVPRGVALEVDFPAGELTIQGVAGDLTVDAGAGEIRISMREHDVRSVRLGVGIGEASLSVAGRGIEGSGWLGQKVRWGQGDGPSRVAVNLGVGELDVKLD